MTDARLVHLHDQLGAALADIAAQLGAYRRKLKEEGVSDVEAWALTQRLEERLMGPILDDARDPGFTREHVAAIRELAAEHRSRLLNLHWRMDDDRSAARFAIRDAEEAADRIEARLPPE